MARELLPLASWLPLPEAIQRGKTMPTISVISLMIDGHAVQPRTRRAAGNLSG